jgi:hypothetical protein
MADRNLLKSKIEDNKIIIEIPKEFFISSQEERMDTPYRVTNEKRMLEWIQDNVFYFNTNPEIDYTEFDNFIDQLFVEAYESGEPWLEGII